VSHEVALEGRAVSQAAAFLQDDPDGLRSVFQAIDRLADDPRPAESFPFGSPDLRRLHVG
jgi:mRNA interferase RelE/StbE